MGEGGCRGGRIWDVMVLDFDSGEIGGWRVGIWDGGNGVRHEDEGVVCSGVVGEGEVEDEVSWCWLYERGESGFESSRHVKTIFERKTDLLPAGHDSRAFQVGRFDRGEWLERHDLRKKSGTDRVDGVLVLWDSAVAASVPYH